MVKSRLLCFVENGVAPDSLVSNKSFSVAEIPWISDAQKDEHLYQQIVYKVLTNPNQLISHLQRIYFTYSHDMAEPLYAALVDLFMVLNGRGKALSNRMMLSTRSLLTEQQTDELVYYLEHYDTTLLTGNKFSVQTKGLVGVGILLTEQNKITVDHDPLVIARDYIEYSQLDAAIETLEAGVIEDSQRLELQKELLELYKVTRNIQAFTKMHQLLKEKKVGLSAGWQELAEFFVGLTNEK